MEEMPASRAALELFDPVMVGWAVKPIARWTASAVWTRYESRWPGICADGEEEMTSVLPVMPARSASSFTIVAIFFSRSAITSLLVERNSTLNQASAALAFHTSEQPSMQTFSSDEGLR